MRYEDIRDAFAFCGVAVTRDGISVIFPLNEQQRLMPASIGKKGEKDRGIFEELCLLSSGLYVGLYPGSSVMLRFLIPMAMEEDLIFPPKASVRATETSQEDFRKFLDNFRYADLNDQEEVARIFANTVKSQLESEPFSFEGVMNWDALFNASGDFCSVCRDERIEVEETPPDEDLDFGTIDLFFESERNTGIFLDHEASRAFFEMASVSDVLCMEGTVEPDCASLTVSFYS